MTSSALSPRPIHVRPVHIAITAALLVAGLAGHLFAADAIGGSRMAYLHHTEGFFLIWAVTGAIIAVLGRFFWRGRLDITLVAMGAVQALFGLWIYLVRFSVH
jgi:hypothetical protein